MDPTFLSASKGGAALAGDEQGEEQPQQKQQHAAAVAHLQDALAEASAEPGATVHYAAPGAGAPPDAQPGGVGTLAGGGTGSDDLRGRDLFVAPSADGRTVDVVERIDLPGPEAIRTDLKTGFGAHAGPVSGTEGAEAAARRGSDDGGSGAGAATTGQRAEGQ